MGRSFNIGRLPTGTPDIISYQYTSGQTFKKGALVVDVAAGTISECGADPTTGVLGVALEDANSRPGGAGIMGDPSYITGGNKNEVSVAVASRSALFSCRGVNGATDPVTPTVSHIGEQYGVVKSGDDWCLDEAETVNVVVEVVDVDIDQKIFFVKFLEAVLALP